MVRMVRMVRSLADRTFQLWYFRPEGAAGEKLLVGSVEPDCDAPHHSYPDDPESVYAGREHAGLTDQWTNQVQWQSKVLEGTRYRGPLKEQQNLGYKTVQM